MQEKNKLSVAISIASLLTAAIAAGISNQALPAAAFWVAAAAFVGVLASFVWPPLRNGLNRYSMHRRRQRIAEQFRTRLIGLVSVIREITSSSSDSRSVGSILNTAHTYKSLSAHSVNAYLAHLCALGGWSQCIHKRAVNGEIAGAALAHELNDVTREYIRLCNLASGEIEAHFAESASAGRALDQAWTQILRQANLIADELVAVNRAINLEDPQMNLPIYMVPANDLGLNIQPAEASTTGSANSSARTQARNS